MAKAKQSKTKHVSMSECAKQLGIARKTLQRHRKRVPPLPTHGEENRGDVLVDVEEVRAYLERNGLGGAAGRRSRVVEALAAAQAADGPAAPMAASPIASTPAAAPPPALSLEEQQTVGELFAGLDGLKSALGASPESMKKLVAVAAARKEWADARKRELEVAQRRGELLDAAEVERGRVQRVLVVKQGLRAMPAKLAARLVGRTSEEIHAEIEAEVDTLQRAFSEEFAKL